ncbi:MAG: class I SAM-dependent methyltransferase [Flavobacteriales bacterium]|jgi:SAM-dependent methyltransferase|uniref:class I SAM-dependent methyltransferase n=1 Tax=Candidatus Ulvibacter alkanivorans TaxID=2267620 RepID=UPI000DF4072C|nr:class I SAM-dependent methyltransferase [Candidatus Ulvibacter alkanivorans]MCH2491042.1 class I SAM-dependent methyltransferase [Flavobacteriales bacterium]
MEAQFEERYHEIEKTHFWFKARRDYIKQLLKNTPKDAKILDIGCSSGILLNELQDEGFALKNLFGVDFSEKAIANCKANGIENAFVMDAQHITLPQQFDIIIASDCLEHLQEDESALQNWYNLLDEQGKIYVFVPAHMSLWSYHDEVNLHYRRYSKKELISKMQSVGFKIKKSSFWNAALFPPVYLLRKFASFSRKATKETTGDLKLHWTNPVLYSLLRVENKILSHTNLPFGISTFCIASKR